MVDSGKRVHVTMNSSTGYRREFFYICENRNSHPSVAEGLMHSWTVGELSIYEREPDHHLCSFRTISKYKVRDFNE